ncbi:MAG: hypothetical protein QXK51_09610 [Candidatus Methanomethylicia archaeon]
MLIKLFVIYVNLNLQISELSHKALIAKLFKFSSLFFLRGVSEISDDEWKLIKSLLSPRISRPSVDDMLVERYSIRTYYWYRWICLLIMTLLNFRRLKRWRS